mgnify:CR=1 FL=1
MLAFLTRDRHFGKCDRSLIIAEDQRQAAILDEEIQIGQIKGPILNWSLAFLLLTITLMVISISVLIGRYSLNRSLSS